MSIYFLRVQKRKKSSSKINKTATDNNVVYGRQWQHDRSPNTEPSPMNNNNLIQSLIYRRREKKQVKTTDPVSMQ